MDRSTKNCTNLWWSIFLKMVVYLPKNGKNKHFSSSKKKKSSTEPLRRESTKMKNFWPLYSLYIINVNLVKVFLYIFMLNLKIVHWAFI